MSVFNVFDKDGKKLGCVIAKTEGHAKNKAVEEKIVSGRKQICKVQEVPYDDPYEQSFEDIYG